MPDQCSACGQENRAGARFCSSCGAPLAPRCESCGGELTAGARFCDACGAPAPAEVEAGRRTVSVIFSDLAGSTAMQEALDAEAVRQIMARYYDVMRAAVQRHEGQLDKFIGDAVVATFGQPTVREDDALRAVRCAAAMVADLEHLNLELERQWGTRLVLRTGINTGELVINPEGILVGDTMNTAARFEQAAPPGEVLLGEPTWRLVRNHVTLEEVAPLELKGKSSPVRAWRLVSVKHTSDETVSDAPLVGRTDELGRLRAVLDQALAEQACRLVTIVGSPGLGKSRLAEEFARDVSDRALVLHGHCEPSGEGNAFLPVAEVIREVAGIGEADAPELAREKLRALAPADDPDRERLVARVAGVLGIGEPASAQETFWALRRGLEDLARVRPLVVMLDDVHWAQPMLLDLLEHLIEWISGAPVLILVLARPELRETREVLTAVGRRASDVIELEPLDIGESRALVAGLLGAADLPSELLARILETTEGNPLFLGELVRMLVDEGALVRTEDGWAVAAGAAAFDVPPTIQALLSARIGRLRADERAVVERASVIGQQFYRGAVAELVTPAVRADIDGHLAALRRKEMVEPEGIYWIDEPVYRFHHVLIRDAAYRLLLKEARAALHERFADWLADKAGALIGEYEEVIAFHLEQAHAYRGELGPLDDAGRALGTRAATHFLSAGRRAMAREDLAAAANLLSRAVECKGDDDPGILWELAEAVLSAGDAALGADVAARHRVAAGDDRLGLLRAVVIEGQLANLTGEGDPTATADAVATAAPALRELGDGAGEAKAWHVVAQSNARLGRVGLVETALDRALTAARGVDDKRRTTAVLAAAPRAALWGPSTVVRASGRCLDVVRILRMTPGNRHVEALALRCQAVLEAMRGRFDAAREILAGARATLEELGLSLELHETRTHAGMVELLADDASAAVGHLESALAGFESLGADAAAAQTAALLGRALVTRDDPGDAEAAIEHVAYAELHGGEDLRTAVIAASAGGEALARVGELDDGVASAQRAVDLAGPTDALADKADASMALGRVLRAAGRGDEARRAAETARGWYEAKGHLVGAEAAARLAGEVTGPAAAKPAVADAAASVLGRSPAEQLLAEIQRLQHARDYDAIGALVTDDWYHIDHRPLAWPEAHGREECLGIMRSVFDSSPAMRVEYDKIVARGEHVIAVRQAWRGRGLKAGAFEVEAGGVHLFRDGLCAGSEFYEPDDVGAMLARFAELGGRSTVTLGDRPPERLFSEYAERLRRQELDAVLDLYRPDFEMVDHRTTIAQGNVRGREANRAFMQSMLDVAPDLRLEVHEVLACDQRVLALRGAACGHASDGGGAAEVPFGGVYVVADGLFELVELYDDSDRDGLLLRYAQLGGRPAALGDRPPERVWAEFVGAVARQDIDAIIGLRPEGFVQRDHRELATAEYVGHEGIRAVYGAIFSLSNNTRADVDEVLCCDDRVVALRVAYRGTSVEHGSIAEVPLGIVSVVQDGLILMNDVYEYDDDAAMLARFAELGGRLGPTLGDRPPERWLAEYCRRFGQGSLDSVAELYAPDIAVIDRRTTVSQEMIRGPEAVRATDEAVLAMARDARYEITDVLACDDRVIAARAMVRGHARDGGGPVEALFGVVDMIEDGRARLVELCDPDDEMLLTRFAELGGGILGPRAPERVEAELVLGVARRDMEAIVRLYSTEYVLTDHRPAGGGAISGREGIRATYESVFAIAPDVVFRVDEVLACDERVIAVRCAFAGHAADGGGYSEMAIGVVAVIEDGQFLSDEQFAYEDTAGMIRRFAELGGGLAALGDTEAERFWRRYSQVFAARDIEPLASMYAADATLVDHRSIAWEECRGREACVGVARSGWDISEAIWIEVDGVLAADDRVTAWSLTWKGRSRDGGGAFSLSAGLVTVVEDGLWVSQELYDHDDRESMLARFAELAGTRAGPGVLPPQRWLSEHAGRWRAGDWEGLPELFAEDSYMEDHRSLQLWERVDGREGWRAFYAATSDSWRPFYAGTSDTDDDARDFTVLETVAGDARVVAARVSWSFVINGAEGAIECGIVVRVEGGLALGLDVYDPGDTEAILARFAELTGKRGAPQDRPPARLYARVMELLVRGDIDGVLDLYAPGATLIDRRAIVAQDALGEPKDFRGFFEGILAGFPDVRFDGDEILACDDCVCVLRTILGGHAADGGGEVELPFGVVECIEAERITHVELYGYDDVGAMIARYAELGGGLSVLGDSPPERFYAAFARGFARRDIDAMLEFVAPDVVHVDHREIGWEPLRGHAGYRATIESGWAEMADVRLEIAEVLALADDAIALRVRWIGHGDQSAGFAEFSLDVGTVSSFAAGRLAHVDQFDADDREAILTRFAELQARAS